VILEGAAGEEAARNMAAGMEASASGKYCRQNCNLQNSTGQQKSTSQ
jgi:hypothetical protein